jgi:hypothetical protein
MTDKTTVSDHYFCPDQTCEYHLNEVTNGGTDANPGYNCPQCDKPLQGRFQVQIESSLDSRSDLV